MTQEEEIAQLKKQLSELVERFSEVVEQLSKAEARESQQLAHLSAMQAENQTLHEQLAVAQKRIEELEKQKTPPPAFVKANVVKSFRLTVNNIQLIHGVTFSGKPVKIELLRPNSKYWLCLYEWKRIIVKDTHIGTCTATRLSGCLNTCNIGKFRTWI